jgi:hypothetical protein
MKHHGSTSVALALSASLAVGCATGPTSGNGSAEGSTVAAPLIQTDQSVYTARRGSDSLADGRLYAQYVELDLQLRYTNRTAGEIYLPTCNSVHPPILEKREAAGWIIAFAPIVQSCLGPPVVLREGQVYEYSYPLRGYLPGSRVHPQFETALPGTYRLVWRAYETWTPSSTQGGLGRELPLSARVSNEFRVIE